MKTIISQTYPGVTPRGQAGNLNGVAPAPVPQAAQVSENPVAQPVPQSNIIQNKEPLNKQMLRTMLMKYKTTLEKLMNSMEKLQDNDVELQLANLLRNMQLILSSASAGRKKTQINPSQMAQQSKQVGQEAARA